MTFHSPCDCSHLGCYSCAIDYVIAQVHGFGGCICIAEGKSFSKKCGAGTRADFEEAFRRAEAPYLDLAKARAHSRGIVGAPDGRSIWAKQDLDRAAEILNAEAARDSVSFDAALWFVSERVRQGQVVPEVLRQWASDAIIGRVEKPKAKGKYPGATLTRDRLIFLLLHDLVKDLKLKATSANPVDGKSACNAVAEAFQMMGLQPDSYETIRRIWDNRRNLNQFCFPENV